MRETKEINKSWMVRTEELKTVVEFNSGSSWDFELAIHNVTCSQEF